MPPAESLSPRAGRPPAASRAPRDRGAARLAAAVCLCFMVFGTAALRATGSPPDAGHEGHANHLGLVIGPVRNLNENKTILGLGLEYERRLSAGNGLFGIGAAAEMVFDEHRHYVVSALVCFHPGGAWTLTAAPGILFIDQDGTEKRAAIHFAAEYEFELGRVSLAPEVSVGLAGDDVHLMLGLHIGFGF